MIDFTKCLLAVGFVFAGSSCYAGTIFSDDFESPDVTAAESANNTSGASNSDWVRATQGFGAGRNGTVDESSGQFTDPTGEQAYAFRYTNSGLTSALGVIGALAPNTTYTVSFDVVMDGGRNDGRPYVADLFVWNPGARRDDVRNNGFGTLLAGTSGNAPDDGTYETVTFAFTTDALTPPGLIGGDLTLRFKGATTSANIDNVLISTGGEIPEPGSVALLAGLTGVAAITVARRRVR